MAVGRGTDRVCPVVNRLIRWAVTFVMVAALCFAFYEAGQEVGRSKARVQVVEKQVEVIRYVEKKKAEIHARPNAGRDSPGCPVYPAAGEKVAVELEKISYDQAPNFWEWLGRIDKLRQELEVCRL